ncbi:hypothetical protein QBC34DRAFT_409954 [Podospora aff. communis PSN243]|uniref:Uncharacterized protein n=1 Tax=Podospora aff. communis PSN243 TaxID=3040156 RepID=A0AAV9GJ21_9PEZI|nr:hypothetical protein QBC34DRAFT_409954 [Podospora aff. communis PSN243]
MRPRLLPALLAAVAPLAVAVPSFISAAPEPSACVKDDLFNFLKAHIRSARPFCRDYLNIPVTVSYVSTVTPTATATSVETTTTTYVESSTITSIETSILTSTETTIVSTATVTAGYLLARNSQIAEFSDGLLASYLPQSISSACSCLPARGCHRKGTKTESAVTSTLLSTLTVETTSTWLTTTYTTTTTDTTTTLSATSTTEVPAPQETWFRAGVYVAGSEEKRYLACHATSWNTEAGSLYLTSDIALAAHVRLDSSNRLVHTFPDSSELVTLTWQAGQETRPSTAVFDLYLIKISNLAAGYSEIYKAYKWSMDDTTGELTVVGGGDRDPPFLGTPLPFRIREQILGQGYGTLPYVLAGSPDGADGVAMTSMVLETV